jgi:hypothetical protein
MSDDTSLELLNIYEIEEPEGTRHLVCFLEPVMAGAQGIPVRSIVGEFDPRDDGEFDPSSFRLNPEFVEAFMDFMNSQVIESAEMSEQSRANPGGFLHLIDPRRQDVSAEPPLSDVLGAYAVGPSGQAVPNSFRYNPDHVMFDPTTGPSGILTDRRFYDWLHAQDADSGVS